MRAESTVEAKAALSRLTRRPFPALTSFHQVAAAAISTRPGQGNRECSFFPRKWARIAPVAQLCKEKPLFRREAMNMVNGQIGTILCHIRQLAARGTENLSDRELLNRFAAGREEAAFAELVQRHGRMVWGICRHVLRQEQDAEDVFQATFLVLAQKAGSIRNREAVGSWLHGTAYRLALRAKRDAATRRIHERRGRSMPREKALSESALREALTLVYEEVQGLPEKYRAAFVLCCLEGKSVAEAAQQLGWKEVTVTGALARARKQLRARLVRRGVALPAALCAIPLAQRAAEAAVRARLVKSTVKAARASTAGQRATAAA